MTRSVNCISGGKVVKDNLCDAKVKPSATESCRSQECVGVWVLGEWSKVNHMAFEEMT